jgi:hypothetical protein
LEKFLITQFIIFFTWLAFRITDLDVLLYALYKYVIWDFKTESTLNYVEHNMFQISLIVGFFILNFISYRQKNLPEKISNLKSIYWVTFLVWTVILILMFYNGSQVDFIYFRF